MVRLASQSTSVSSSKEVTPRFVSLLLNSFNDPKNVFTNNEESQTTIENLIFDDYESSVASNTNAFRSGGIKVDLLGPVLGRYLLDKKEVICCFASYINNLKKLQQSKLDSANLKGSGSK